MKKFKLTRNVQIFLATIIVIVVGAIVVGVFANNKTSAATRTCSKCGVTMSLSGYSDDTYHKWICDSSSCGNELSEKHSYDSSNTWASQYTTNRHYWYSKCAVCLQPYKYTSGVCSDNDGDGFCDNCGGETTNTGSGGGSGGGSEGGSGESCTSHTKGDVECTYKDSTYHHLKIYCANCNVMYDEYDAIHSNFEDDATDLGNGKHTITCSDCEHAITESHKIQTDPRIEPTCTKKGWTAGTSCEKCYAVITEQESIPALGHEEVVDEAVEPTCTKTGLTEGKHCSRCNEVLVEQEEIPTLGHEEVIDEAVEPTCTETGLTEGKHCSRCNEVLVEQEEIPALGHEEVVDEAVEPTCTKTGLTEGKHCSRCNEVLVEKEEIPALDHLIVIDEAVEPTCTEKGLTEGKHCSRCNEILVKQEEVPALGHEYENGECIRCDQKEPTIVEEVTITSNKYEIDEKYISNVQPQTTVEQFKNNIETNATEIKIYNKDNEEVSEDSYVGTGMKAELKNENATKTYTIVVRGDVDGDGKIKLSDMSIVNRCRLNKRTLENEYFLAADVNGDEIIDIKDLTKINRFRLNKITEL